MAKFSKGQSGNPNGRPKGSINKATQKIRAVIRSVVSEELSEDGIQKLMKDLKPAEKAKFILGILPYAVPKLAQIKEGQNDPIDLRIEIVGKDED